MLMFCVLTVNLGLLGRVGLLVHSKMSIDQSKYEYRFFNESSP